MPQSLKGSRVAGLRLLADKLVELSVVENIPHETVQRVLKKRAQAHLRTCWVIPPKHNAEFVAYIEDVLDLYEQAYDPDYRGD